MLICLFCSRRIGDKFNHQDDLSRNLKAEKQVVPCLVEEEVMAGLLLLGLLACASIAIAQPPLLVLTEMCYYSMDIDYIERQFWNSSLRVVATEGG